MQLDRERLEDVIATAGGVDLMNTFPRPRVCLLHIPKTAGTALTQWLMDIYGVDTCFSDRLNNLDTYDPCEFEKYRLFAGHFDMAQCSLLPRGTRVVTFLREPRARLLSLYYFWRSYRWPVIEAERLEGPRLAKTLELEEFLRRSELQDQVNNAMVRQLAGRLYAGPNGEYLTSAEQALSKAKEALESMAFVGIQEEYETSVDLMCRVLTLPFPQKSYRAMDHRTLSHVYPERIERVERPDGFSEAAKSIVDEMTELDQRLYDFALERFERRKAEALSQTPFTMEVGSQANPDHPLV
jgi:hypothetical protein